MTIKHYAQAAGKTAEITNLKAEAVIKDFLNEVKKELQKGNQVAIRGFGTFTVREVKERKGMNVRKGTPVIVPAHKKIKFKQSSKIIL